eukprot:scaffold322761_cov28-Tisochrysis_lutea.AAC.5
MPQGALQRAASEALAPSAMPRRGRARATLATADTPTLSCRTACSDTTGLHAPCAPAARSMQQGGEARRQESPVALGPSTVANPAIRAEGGRTARAVRRSTICTNLSIL